jgi:putative two-component system response regulator
MANKDTILIVDDVPANLEMMINILKDEYSIIVATNGEKALRLSHAEKKPDIILLDIMMPQMDGYEVCRRLKADPVTSQIPVIFITAKNEFEDEIKGLDLGAVDYIIKPVSPALVKARVSTHIELKRLRKLLSEKDNG